MTSSTDRLELPALSDVTEAQWAALAGRRIFFGHQSVGENIMAGVADVLADNPQIRLNIVAGRDPVAQPAFAHAPVGRNDFPLEKFDDFVQVAATAFDARGGIAMVKLCYVDIHRQTDPEALFAEYQRRVAALKARNPSLTIVHFTAPLTTVENWKGSLRAVLSGNATQRERNAVRERYNELMRQAYAGREPLFDIARLESTLPDGSRVFYRAGGRDVPVLAAEYTDDGGHLNAAARRYVAEQLLIMLARLDAMPASHTPAVAAREGAAVPM